MKPKHLSFLDQIETAGLHNRRIRLIQVVFASAAVCRQCAGLAYMRQNHNRSADRRSRRTRVARHTGHHAMRLRYVRLSITVKRAHRVRQSHAAIHLLHARACQWRLAVARLSCPGHPSVPCVRRRRRCEPCSIHAVARIHLRRLSQYQQQFLAFVAGGQYALRVRPRRNRRPPCASPAWETV